MKNLVAIIVSFLLLHQSHAQTLRSALNAHGAGNSASSFENSSAMKFGGKPMTINAPKDGNRARDLLEQYPRHDEIPNIDSYIVTGSLIPPGGGSFAQTGDRGGLFHTANKTTADAKIFKKNPGNSTSTPPTVYEPWMPPPPPSSWVAELSTGFGRLTYIIEEGITFDDGIIHVIDGLFTPAGSFVEGLKEAGFTQLAMVFDTKLPMLRDTLDKASCLTFFGPSISALHTAQSKLSNLNDSQWETLLNYHTLDLTNGFIGYTPSFDCGKVYKTKSGGNVLVTFKNGDTYVNDAKIVGRDFILQNGVMQILDKVLEVQSPDATTLPGPDGILVDISRPVVCDAPNPSPVPEVPTPTPTPDVTRNDSFTPTAPPLQQTGDGTVVTIGSFPITVILGLVLYALSS